MPGLESDPAEHLAAVEAARPPSPGRRRVNRSSRLERARPGHRGSSRRSRPCRPGRRAEKVLQGRPRCEHAVHAGPAQRDDEPLQQVVRSAIASAEARTPRAPRAGWSAATSIAGRGRRAAVAGAGRRRPARWLRAARASLRRASKSGAPAPRRRRPARSRSGAQTRTARTVRTAACRRCRRALGPGPTGCARAGGDEGGAAVGRGYRSLDSSPLGIAGRALQPGRDDRAAALANRSIRSSGSRPAGPVHSAPPKASPAPSPFTTSTGIGATSTSSSGCGPAPPSGPCLTTASSIPLSAAPAPRGTGRARRRPCGTRRGCRRRR